MGLLDRLLRNSDPTKQKLIRHGSRPILYSWILSGKFAIGPMPQTAEQWLQLDQAGFRSRFSCCYPEEEIFAAPPSSWQSDRVPLPDHRRQELMKPENLAKALLNAEAVIESQPATYLHCFAGRERSPLIAVGLLARGQGIDVLTALDHVRRCHPGANPIFSDLDQLERLLKSMEPNLRG
jgi:hypothetical protein